MATTVTAGNSASFTLGPFAKLTLSSSNGVGTLVLTSTAPKLSADQSLSIQNGTFGPYGCPMTVSMVVRQGAVDYTVVETSNLVSQDASHAGLVGAYGTTVLGDVQSKPSAIQTRAICAFPTNTATHGANRNTHHQLTTEAHFDQVRLILLNAQTSTQTGIQASIGVSAAPITTVAEMNAFTPAASVDLTWSTASSVTQAAGVGVRDVSYTVSDWMDLSSVTPTTGSFPFVHVRVYQPSGNANITVYGATSNLSWMAAATDGRTLQTWYKDTTDTSQGMTTWSSGAAAAPRIVPFILQYKSRGRIRTLGTFGDSLAFGQGPTNYGEGYGRLLQRLLSSPTRPVEHANLGMPGATATEFYNNAVKLIAAGIVPHWSIYHAGSPNDISTTISASQINTMRTLTNKAADQLSVAGAAVWIADWGPSNTAVKSYGATDSLRVSYNAQVAAPGWNQIGLAAAVSGAASGGQIQINAAFANADGLHFNDAGNAAIAANGVQKFQFAS